MSIVQFSFGNKPIPCHAYNKDESEIAIAKNGNIVEIHKSLSNGKWEKTHELIEHTGKVTGIDWAPNSNQIVTCGADRNAYVWKLENGKWKQTLVLLRINRGAVTVKWSPLENKFAVGSGSRCITICYFDPENNWWISKHIKKPIRSTVLCLSWHPNNYLIAAGTSDFKARVFSAYVREIEERPQANVWGKRLPFNALLAEYQSPSGGWVHGIGFSPSGNGISWVSHDSTISYAEGGSEEASTIRTSHLPFTSMEWLNDGVLVAVGFDCNPILFKYENQTLTEIGKVDQNESSTGGSKLSGRKMWEAMDSKAQNTSHVQIKTRHKNSILEVLSTNSGFSTAGADGQIIQWSNDDLSKKFKNLQI